MMFNLKKQKAINGNSILSKNMEYLKRKKKEYRHFKTLSLFSKLILLILGFVQIFLRRL